MEKGKEENKYVVDGRELIDYGEKKNFEVREEGKKILWGKKEKEGEEK